MSDLDQNKSKDKFQNAVAWSLPEIKGAVSGGGVVREQKIDIDDVKQFESRIKKQIEAIKREQDNPTYLTVKQIEEVQKQAYDEAYKEAYKKGTEDSEKFLESKLQEERKELKQKALQLQQCFNVLSKPLKDVDLEVEQQLTDIVFHFCKQLLTHELNIDATHILRLIQKSVASLPVAQRNILVKLNPSDIDLLKECDINVSEQDWKVETDESVSAGGCIIETETSSMDLGIETRLKKLTSQLYSGLKQPDDVAINLDNKNEELDSDLEIKDE